MPLVSSNISCVSLYLMLCHTGGLKIVLNITAVRSRFTTEWTILLQPEAFLAAFSEVSYTT
jgi:hypothetical protein